MTDPIQASLTIRLLANDVVVAQSTDPLIWQSTLARIMGQTPAPEAAVRVSGGTGTAGSAADTSQLAEFARQLGVDEDALVGSFGPTPSSPFIYLDMGAWEAFRRNSPSRGRGAVAPTALAATALAFWLRIIGQGNPTQAQAREVLGTINVSDKNPSRSITNCDWLQLRGSSIVLNPQFVSRARAVLTGFVRREAIDI